MLESIVDFLAGGLAFDLRVLVCIAIANSSFVNKI